MVRSSWPAELQRTTGRVKQILTRLRSSLVGLETTLRYCLNAIAAISDWKKNIGKPNQVLRCEGEGKPAFKGKMALRSRKGSLCLVTAGRGNVL